MTTYNGECFCGAVKVEVSGRAGSYGVLSLPIMRSWSGGPVNAFTLWKPDAVRITAGAEHVGMYKKTPASERLIASAAGTGSRTPIRHRRSRRPRCKRNLTYLRSVRVQPCMRPVFA
jgi:hypothetical protein